MKTILVGLTGAIFGSLLTYFSLSEEKEIQINDDKEITKVTSASDECVQQEVAKCENLKIEIVQLRKQVKSIAQRDDRDDSDVSEDNSSYSRPVNQKAKSIYVKTYALDTQDLDTEVSSLYEKGKAKIIKDPISFLKKSKPITSEDIYSPLSGSFSGYLYLLKGNRKGEVHNVEYNSSLESNSGILSGDYMFILSYKGKEYSRNRGSGDNNQIKMSPQSSEDIILEVSPADYLQVTSITDTEIIGNYYSRFDYMGVMKLKKE